MTRFSEFQIYLFGSTEDRGGLVLNVDLGNVLTEKSDILVLSVLLSVRLKTLENSRPELGKVKESLHHFSWCPFEIGKHVCVEICRDVLVEEVFVNAKNVIRPAFSKSQVDIYSSWTDEGGI